MPDRPPGLYLHLPFCRRICPYCDFSVLPGPSEMRAAFVADLALEISTAEPFDDPFDTIYLGGGTPSALTDEQLSELLTTVRSELPVVERPWIAMEANPEDVTPDRVRSWRRFGVEFLSLGVQSFDDAALAWLGRDHDGAQARRAVDLALDAGFPTVSVDLIFGWPGQTLDQLDHDVEAADETGAQHLSAYQLTIHPRTRFGFRAARGELTELGSDDQADLFERLHARLGDRGLVAYEVSNFARAPTHRSAHNQKYWTHTPYLGLGPSAHSFDGSRTRWWNERKIKPWTEKVRGGVPPRSGSETLTDTELDLETLMLSFRRPDGVRLDALRTADDDAIRTANEERIAIWVRDRLVVDDGTALRPTVLGMSRADGLAGTLELPADVSTLSSNLPLDKESHA